MTAEELKEIILECSTYSNEDNILYAMNAVDEFVASITPLTIEDFNVGDIVHCTEYGKGAVTLKIDDTLWVQFGVKTNVYYGTINKWGRGKESSVSQLNIIKE
jgi:hypothetical protein